MTYTREQAKGYRHEASTRAHLLEIGGKIERAAQSGSYTGDPDLTWTLGLLRILIDCKYGKDWIAKRHRKRLDKAQICIDRSANETPIVFMELETLKTLCAEMAALGVQCVVKIAGDRDGKEAGAALEAAIGSPSSHSGATPEARVKRPPMCDDCGKYPSDPPSRLCPGCEAYQDHLA